MSFNWFTLALIGHVSNGAAFLIDKILLRSAFTRSATYAGVVGLMSGTVAVLIPFVKVWPSGGIWIVALVSGATFILALWAFFAALSKGETSRVVPIVGSLIPIFTLAGTFTFLGERLTDVNFVGFGCLIVATVLLSSGRGKGRPDKATIWLAVTAAALFAIASVTVKATYDASEFLGGLVVTRLTAALMALIILVWFDRRAGREVLIMFHLADSKLHKIHTISNKTVLLALAGQSLGAFGFVFIQWATANGSASIVNALQAVQYAFLVLAALLLRHVAPKLLGEDLTRQVLLRKSLALALTAVGLYLVV